MLGKLLGKNNKEQAPVLALDIGSHSIKALEFDPNSQERKLLSAGMAYTPEGAFSDNVISDPEAIGKTIKDIVESNGIVAKKVATAVAGPNCFSKVISTGVQEPAELEANISFEASNVVPFNLEDIHLDYQVLRRKSPTALEVLLVAVKNEVVRGYLSAIEAAGLEPVIVDIDSYSLANMFEQNYPEDVDKMVALVNIGSKFTSVDIVRKNKVMFKGEVTAGGAQYTKALAETLQVSEIEAEDIKKGTTTEGIDPMLVRETIEKVTGNVASELERQIGFFWNAAEAKRPIDIIYLTGGGSLTPGLREELSIKTGVECNMMDSFKSLKGLESFEEAYLKQIGPLFSIGVGLAGRQMGDKQHRFS